MKLLLKIKYDGASFHGFQTQPGLRCVQSTLTETLPRLFGFDVNVTGCSRTDSGVHALGFVVSVDPKDENRREKWCQVPVSKIARAANNLLGDDISVVGAASVSDDFHPRYSALGKSYIYRMYDGFIPDPFRKNRALMIGKDISEKQLGIMNGAAGYFVGRHDFTSFMASGSKITDCVRTVHFAEVKRSADEIVFRVGADGFLYNMVRIMTGTLLDAAFGRIEPEDVAEIITRCDRSLAGETVKPCGLYLEEVFYRENIEWLAD